ncbi:hypothetical protein GCM10011571_14240 [Marinithermofilum abyssi]|uniref:Uncharacterized protein n=1 Tax=Marinithermofilum abyssi TaxID=1571185 RepID=A0A8J2VEX1_9BACL|nr:hypothetical protein [Marinithermofilum abyssi]GGE13939.1 hypothetical protein GCM10011571_14240 [Marinithermofilum abyssi]
MKRPIFRYRPYKSFYGKELSHTEKEHFDRVLDLIIEMAIKQMNEDGK